jgi:phosphoribosylformylglycinamidine synthase
LVNAFSAGILEHGKSASATAYGAGNPVYIVGSATGKDGIHGATFASADITEDSAEDLPSVQVGDPFQEKLLLEATLEVIDKDLIIGVQDMGAAGIICSTSEMSAKGGAGMKINLEKVPTRQADMQAWEILLSESQERMLIVGKPDTKEELEEIFDKWDLNCEQIGEVTETGELEFYHHDELVAKVPAESLVLGGGAPVYQREYSEPAYYQKFKEFGINSIKDIQYEEIPGVARFLLSHPNIASKKWVYEQYDSMVGTANASLNNPTDAAVVFVKGSRDKYILVTTDCNSRYVNADPEVGTCIAVAEAARNIVCSGGDPAGVTNCLNFGNPYNPEVYWQFVGAIKGMKRGCEKFGTPVTGGNVSFYNQSSDEGPVFPTPTIGMLGVMDGLEKRLSLAFQNKGDLIYLVGKSKDDIASSEYLYSYKGIKASPAPYFDLDCEYEVQQAIKKTNEAKLLQSAHDLSDGGLWITLCESAFPKGLGFDISVDTDFRMDAYLFGEAQSRVLVSVKPENQEAFENQIGTDFRLIGKVTDANFVVDDHKVIGHKEASELYSNSLEEIIMAK